MELDEFIKKEQLAQLSKYWRELNWWQRKMIVLQIVPFIALDMLNEHIERRRASFEPRPRVHWVGK